MKQRLSKIIFIIQPQSIIDVITNSSSELFIFQGKEKEVIEQIISAVYPTYLSEYEELISLYDLSVDSLDELMNWLTGAYCWPAKKSDYEIPGTFTFDEIYEPESDKPAWNHEIQYELKKLYKGEDKWDYSFVTEENREWVLNKLDPNKSMFLLYSIHENPDWEMQEVLMKIGSRHHLG